METVKFEFEIYHDDYVNAGKASLEIKKYLLQMGIDHRIIRKIATSCYEAEMNLVIHSVGGSIQLEISPQWITVFVRDEGPGIENIVLALTPGYSTANEKAREMGFGAGMGLPNMQKNADQFEIDSDKFGTRIRIRYFLKMVESL